MAVRTSAPARIRQDPRRTVSIESETARWGISLSIFSLVVWGVSPLLGYPTSVTVLTLAALALAVVGLKKPHLGLLAIGMLAALDTVNRNFELLGGLYRYNTLNYWLLVVIGLYLTLLLRLGDVHTRILQALILLVTLMLWFSPKLSNSIQDVLDMLVYFGILVYFARAVRREGAFYWLGFVVGILSAGGSLFYFMLKDRLPYINPNSFAALPLAGLYAICLSIHFARDSRQGKTLLLTLAAVNFVLVFLSASRGNIFAGLVCLVYLVLAIRSFSWSTFILVAALSLGVVFSTLFVEQQERTIFRLEKTFDTSFTLQSRTSGRNLLAQAGWEIFKESPLGIGTGAYRYRIGDFEYLQGREKPAHSAWIKVLAENGILGIILLTAFVLSFTIMGLRAGSYDLLTLGLLVTASLSAAYTTTEFQGKGLWMLAAGVTVILHKDQYIEALDGKVVSRLVRKYGRRRSQTGIRDE